MTTQGNTPLHIRPLAVEDVTVIAEAFTAIGWNKPASQYGRYLEEQQAGLRVTPVAFVDERFAGYLNVVWQSSYPPFREAGIPEIQDFNVLPDFRRRGIGSQLLDAAERLAAERSPVVGIGVGMTSDYGAAQRLYVRRGYLPDGRGLTYDNRFLQHGDSITLDDSLVLHLTRFLK